jgi:TonB family protein
MRFLALLFTLCPSWCTTVAASSYGMPRASWERVQKERSEHVAYFDPLLARLKAEHRRSAASVAAHTSLECTVHFDIRADGTLDRVVVAKSSGSLQFDFMTLAAVRRCFPTTPPPRSAMSGGLSRNEMSFRNKLDEPPVVYVPLQPKG